jgi:hypothetical protein
VLKEKLLGTISRWKNEDQEGASEDKTTAMDHGTQQSPLCEADIAALIEQRLKKTVLEKHRSLQIAKRKTRRKKVCDEEKYSDLDRSDDEKQDETTIASTYDSQMKEDNVEKQSVSSWNNSSTSLPPPESESTRHEHPPTEVAAQVFENDSDDDDDEWW